MAILCRLFPIVSMFQRPRFRLCFIDDLGFNNEDAGASIAAFQRGALER